MQLDASAPAMSTITLSRSSPDQTSLTAANPPSAPPSRRWPRDWPSQQQLLERQHGRLEDLLNSLIAEARTMGPLATAIGVPWDALDCRRLQRALGLHLRLEERWLAHWDCLDAGHRASHRLARTAALRADPCIGDTDANPTSYLKWLQGLQEWFLVHRDGADAIAYSRADHTYRQQQP